MIGKTENRKSYIYVQVFGKMFPRHTASLATAKSIVMDALNQAKANKTSNLLFDVSETRAELQLVDRYRLMIALAKTVQAFAGENNLPPFKIAFFSNRTIFDPERTDEAIAQNKGLNIMFTLDKQEAIDWLEGKTTSTDLVK